MDSNDDILSVLCGQNAAIINALNPETLAFHNKVMELQRNCPMLEWEQDMGATVPYCKLYKIYATVSVLLELAIVPVIWNEDVI